VTVPALVQLPWLNSCPTDLTFEKTTCQGGFFVSVQEITPTAKRSQGSFSRSGTLIKILKEEYRLFLKVIIKTWGVDQHHF